MAYGVQTAFCPNAFQKDAFQIDGSFGGFSAPISGGRFVSREDYDRWKRRRFKKIRKVFDLRNELRPDKKKVVDSVFDAFKSDNLPVSSFSQINISALADNDMLFERIAKLIESPAKKQFELRVKTLIELNNQAIITMLLMEDDD